jgi:phage terminase large subunit-like protein
MYDNPHLLQEIRDALEEEYGATDLGRQELHAEILDEDSNALWTRAWLENSRVPDLESIPSKLLRTSIGVDPSGGAGEQGIVAVAKTMEEHLTAADKKLNLAHGYVLGDRTVHMKPEGWGRRAVEAAIEFDADDIVVEVNFGGDMAVSTIRAAADAMGVNIPIRIVRASRGKKVRAQPVSALSSQGRWHMVGVQPELETQLTTWYPELDWSPDRLDAMVWPAWQNRIVKPTATLSTGGGGMAAMSQSIG